MWEHMDAGPFTAILLYKILFMLIANRRVLKSYPVIFKSDDPSLKMKSLSDKKKLRETLCQTLW
jgi:hypothetical protein